MRRFDDPMDPDVATALTAIDATLDGDPVDPEHADLAELALILSADRPQPGGKFSAGLDRRVAARFAAPAGPRRSRRRWLYAPGALTGVAVAAAVVFVLSSGGSPKPLVRDLAAPTSQASEGAPAATAGASASSAATTTVSASSSASSSASASATPGAPTRRIPLPAPKSASNPIATASSGSNGAQVPAGSLHAPTSGRQVVQSAQLALSAPPSQIDDVAQQVFNVIATEKGVVNNSNVTAGSSGYATFQLSVPSSSLSETMSALSRLQGAKVVSRTDASQDITGQVGGAGRRLADDRALRRSLLKQLAAAITTQQVDSLKIQIRDVEASIARDEVALNKLHGQVDFSSISVTINASRVPVVPASHGGSFTLGRAVHDAGRVLVVAAGVALIALAVLVPLGLLTALAAWIGLAVRHRRREQALDLV